jgi:hypothetical protein
VPTKRAPTNNNDRFADPVLFADKVLGAELWPLQAEIIRAVARDRRVAVKSCHSSGKTFLSAAAALWWVARYSDGRVIVTAPGWMQVRSVLWSQLHRFLRGAKFKFPAQSTQTELKFEPGREILGISTDEASRFQGFHSGHLLIICDEAVGIAADIFEAIEGLLASGKTSILMLGNPTIGAGQFYRAFTRERDAWTRYTISAFDTPNFAGIPDIETLLSLLDNELDNDLWPFLIGRRWVKERYRAWFNGTVENSPLWAARVLGEFPSQGENALLALSWLEAAQRRASDGGGRVTVGVDVAAGGADRTVVTVVDDITGGILGQWSWTIPDARGVVAAELNRWRQRLNEVVVDTIGVGYHLATHLDDLGFPVRMLNVATSAREMERFANIKAEGYWTLRGLLQRGAISGLSDEGLAELAALQYSLDSKGRIVIESKDELKKRLGRSPDLAESFMLACEGRGESREPGLIAFTRDLAIRAHQQDAIAQQPRPPGEEQFDEPEDEDETSNELIDIYNRGQAEVLGAGRCHHCCLPIVGTSSFNGVAFFHPACAAKRLVSGQPV